MMSRWSGLLAAFALVIASTAAMALEDKYFDSAGVNIRYVDEGAGEPIILLHGFTSNIERAWIDQSDYAELSNILAELAKTYRVIAFDSRGHGKSGKPHDRAQYGREMGQDVIRLMDYLKLPKAHIMGYSMGAQITAQQVTKSPERFLTVILGGGAGRIGWTDEDQKGVDILSAELDQGSMTSLILRLWEPKPSADEAKAISAKQLERNDPKALAAVARSRPNQVVSLAEMAAIKVPTLGIVGTLDPTKKPVEELKAALPQMKLVLIEGASHASAPGRPEYIKAVKEFLAEHPASTDGH
jgi:pimeloyl-ACP methyl ester carboxylesterase